MVTLRVVVDSILERSPRGIARYTEELTRALIDFAPRDCDVEGIASAIPDEEAESLSRQLPGLTRLHRTALGRRELRAAWQHGITTKPLGGMIHSPTLFAPLARHDRRETPGEQTVVTIHDATAWLHQEDAGPEGAWQRTMAKRARKHADAIVVPTHAVAEVIHDRLGVGDRIRVIGGAVSSRLVPPADPAFVARRLSLPSEYLLAIGTMEPRKAIESLFKAVASPDFPDLPLVFVGPVEWNGRGVEQAIFESGAPLGRIIHLAPLDDESLAVVIDRATAFVLPSLHEGFGLPAVEAMHFGTPLIHSDAPALLEVVADAGVVVERLPDGSYPERLAATIGATVEDSTELERLSVAGKDRAKAFSWRDSAERVWQLHADL